MHDLQELDDATLIDMLAQCTQRFTQLFRNFTENDPDYQDCKSVIFRVTSELEGRRRKKTEDVSFTSNSELDGQIVSATQ